MVKRQPALSPLPPHLSRVRACVFRTPWGWMGLSETTKGIDSVVLPKALRQAVLSELQVASAELLEGKTSLQLQEAGTIDRLFGGDTPVLRFAVGPLTRDEFSAEGLADSSSDLLWPASILSMGGTSRRGSTVCPRRR
jgi:hypothetical protein